MSGIIDTVGSKSGIVGSDVYPAGHVIQVVKESLVNETHFGGTTYTLITNFTITPIYSNSLIIVEFTAGGMVASTPGEIWCKINGTTSGNFYEATTGYSSESAWVPAPVSVVGFDTPGTVATQTYSLYLKTAAVIASTSARVNQGGSSATQGLAKIATEVKI